jgi:hypothetical protein
MGQCQENWPDDALGIIISEDFNKKGKKRGLQIGDV